MLHSHPDPAAIQSFNVTDRSINLATQNGAAATFFSVVKSIQNDEQEKERERERERHRKKA